MRLYFVDLITPLVYSFTRILKEVTKHVVYLRNEGIFVFISFLIFFISLTLISVISGLEAFGSFTSLMYEFAYEENTWAFLKLIGTAYVALDATTPISLLLLFVIPLTTILLTLQLLLKANQEAISILENKGAATLAYVLLALSLFSFLLLLSLVLLNGFVAEFD